MKSLLTFYTENKLEYQLNGYLQNNTMLFNDKTIAFYYDIVANSGTAYLEIVNKEKLKIKKIETSVVDNFSLSFTASQTYLTEQTANEGLYRFVLEIDNNYYYSDLFCIKTKNLTEINTMLSGMLQIYDADYSEYLLDGYFQNNTTLKNINVLQSFYFDTKLNINSFSCELLKLDINKIKIKKISETKIKNITLLQDSSVIYYNGDVFTNEGIFRYKITVNSKVFFSAWFSVCKIITGEFQFNDNSFFKFNDSDFYNFN